MNILLITPTRTVEARPDYCCLTDAKPVESRVLEKIRLVSISHESHVGVSKVQFSFSKISKFIKERTAFGSLLSDIEDNNVTTL